MQDYPPRSVKMLLACALVAGAFFYWGWHSGENKVLTSMAAGVTNTAAGEPASVDFSTFWKVWNTLNEKFVPPVTVSSSTASTSAQTKPVSIQDRVYGAIEGATAALGDPYTVFFPPKENEAFQSEVQGNFEGVGMEVDTVDGVLTVISPLKGSPAEAAGIKAGDQIEKINGTDTAGMATDDAVNLIRGQAGTTVTLSVLHKGAKDPTTVTLTRAVVNLPEIDSKDLGNGIYKITLATFTQNSADLFRDALRQFVESGDTKLILDLRGNPGGYLDAAIDMASWFLPSGKVVVQEDFGPGKDIQSYRSKGYDIFNNNLKFVILVDGGSASASEILSGALSEQGKATLIGSQTFGKGSVQELDQVTDDTTLKVTIAHWLTPNGNFITGKGITPAIVVPMTQADIDAGRDPQLDRAIQFLNTGK